MSRFKSSNKSCPCEVCGNNSGKCRTTEIQFDLARHSMTSLNTTLHLCMSERCDTDGFTYRGETKDGLWGKYIDLTVAEELTRAWGKGDRQQASDFDPAAWKQQQSKKKAFRLKAEEHQYTQLLPDAERDREIRNVLSQLSLTKEHHQHLLQRGMSESEIATGGYRSVTAWQKLPKKVSPKLAGVTPNGHGLNNSDSGIICPVPNPNGQYTGWQYRLDNSESGRYRWATSVTKKRQTAPTAHLKNGELPIAFCRPMDGVTDSSSIGLAEGVGFKPEIAANRTGQIVLGAAGGNFSGSSETFRHYLERASIELGTKNVILYADAGAVSNPHVLRRYAETQKVLEAQGYSLYIGWWEQTAKTADDIDEIKDIKVIKTISPSEFFQIGRELSGYYPDPNNSPKPILRQQLNRGSTELMNDPVPEKVVTYPHNGHNHTWWVIGEKENDLRIRLPGTNQSKWISKNEVEVRLIPNKLQPELTDSASPPAWELNSSPPWGMAKSATPQDIAQELVSATKLEELTEIKAKFGATATKEGWRYLGETNKPEQERLTALAKEQSVPPPVKQTEASKDVSNTKTNSDQIDMPNMKLESNYESTQPQELIATNQRKQNLQQSTISSSKVEPNLNLQPITSPNQQVEAPVSSNNQTVTSSNTNAQTVNIRDNGRGSSDMSSNNQSRPNDTQQNVNGKALEQTDLSRFDSLIKQIPQLLATSGQEPTLRVKEGSKIAYEGVPGRDPIKDEALKSIHKALKAIEDPKGFTGKLEIIYKGELIYSQKNDVVNDPHGISKYLQQAIKQAPQPSQPSVQQDPAPGKQQAQVSTTPTTKNTSEFEQVNQQIAKLQEYSRQDNQRIAGLEATLAIQQQELEKLRQFQAKMSSSPIRNLGDKLGNWVQGVRTKAADVLRSMAQRVEGKIETTKTEITSIGPQQPDKNATQLVSSVNNQTTSEKSPSIPAQAWERYSNQTQDKNYLGQAREVAISALRDGIGENGVRSILSASPALQKDGEKILHGHVESTLKYAKFYVDNEKTQQQPTQTQQQQQGLRV